MYPRLSTWLVRFLLSERFPLKFNMIIKIQMVSTQTLSRFYEVYFSETIGIVIGHAKDTQDLNYSNWRMILLSSARYPNDTRLSWSFYYITLTPVLQEE